jgi:hypothetical protein
MIFLLHLLPLYSNSCLTGKGVAACDALGEYEHVWLHAIKVLMAPPLACAPSTRLDLLGECSDTTRRVWQQGLHDSSNQLRTGH